MKVASNESENYYQGVSYKDLEIRYYGSETALNGNTPSDSAEKRVFYYNEIYYISRDEVVDGQNTVYIGGNDHSFEELLFKLKGETEPANYADVFDDNKLGEVEYAYYTEEATSYIFTAYTKNGTDYETKEIPGDPGDTKTLPSYANMTGYNFGWFQAQSGLMYSPEQLCLTSDASAWNYIPVNEAEVSDKDEENFYQGVYYLDVPVRTYYSASDYSADPENAAYYLGSSYMEDGRTTVRIYVYNGGATIAPDVVGNDMYGYFVKGDSTYYLNKEYGSYNYRPITPENALDIDFIFFAEGE